MMYNGIAIYYLQRVPTDVVAVKCIERRRLSSTSVENLLTEIELMKRLDHRHTVRLLDFEVLYMVHTHRLLWCKLLCILVLVSL